MPTRSSASSNWRAALRFFFTRLREQHLAEVAGSLTFTTVLALVPLLTVALAVFTAFPLFGTFRVNLQQYFLESLMPATISNGVMKSLNVFSSKAARISAVGGLMLFVTSIALLLTIDNAFNRIWRSNRRRPFAQKLVLYWAAISVGPLLIGASITLTTLIASKAGALGFLKSAVFSMAPFTVSVLGFTLLYVTVPSRPVRFAHAFTGAVVAAVLFEVAKRAFALFIVKVPTYTVVYGAFASVPIFLLWVYLSWLITLFGASIAAAIPVLRYERWRHEPAGGDAFVDALALLTALADARRRTRVPGLSLRDIHRRTGLGMNETEAMLEKLMRAGWAAPLASSVSSRFKRRHDGTERWSLITDPSSIGLAEVFRLFVLDATLRDDIPDELLRVNEAIGYALDETLEDHLAEREVTAIEE
ncbi:MAG TPA: YihY family inner membrane protein [Burkholderiaceae bacterium]|nr:YihY family inner membrane protein [Burkholderiaceae bacterium]